MRFFVGIMAGPEFGGNPELHWIRENPESKETAHYCTRRIVQYCTTVVRL